MEYSSISCIYRARLILLTNFDGSENLQSSNHVDAVFSIHFIYHSPNKNNNTCVIWTDRFIQLNTIFDKYPLFFMDRFPVSPTDSIQPFRSFFSATEKYTRQ